MGAVNNANTKKRIVRWGIRDCGLYEFVKRHTIRSNFIAGNRLFRYIMKVTGSRYLHCISKQSIVCTRGKIIEKQKILVYVCVIIYLYLIIYIYKIYSNV